MTLITSRQNPHVKQIIRLKKRTERDETGLFLIEGYREILRATEGDITLNTLYITPEYFLGSNEETLINTIKAQGAEIITCTKEVFSKFSYRDRPDGLMAVAKKPQQSLEKLLQKDNPLLIVAEGIEKPGNLGTILRSLDAAGGDGLLLADKGTDLYNPNVVRASIGTLFSMPSVEISSIEALQRLKENNIKIVAATPSAETLYTEADLTGPIAIAMGCEQLGLSQLFMDEADVKIKIPMLGAADSLNVAMATTLMLFEAVRQRQERQLLS